MNNCKEEGVEKEKFWATVVVLVLTGFVVYCAISSKFSNEVPIASERMVDQLIGAISVVYGLVLLCIFRYSYTLLVTELAMVTAGLVLLGVI